MAGKRLKFGGNALAEGQHTWYEVVEKDEAGHLDVEGDRLVRGKVRVVRAEPGHEVDADQVLRVSNMPNGHRRIEKVAAEYVARQQASYLSGESAPAPERSKPLPSKTGLAKS